MRCNKKSNLPMYHLPARVAETIDFKLLERLPTKNPDSLRELLHEVEQPVDRRLGACAELSAGSCCCCCCCVRWSSPWAAAWVSGAAAAVVVLLRGCCFLFFGHFHAKAGAPIACLLVFAY